MPRLAEMRNWLQELATRTLPKSLLGKAIYYGLARWEKLCRYTEAGFLPIDNNPAELALRPLAIGRRNWMFLGDEDARDTFAILASLSNV
ncbi:MAG: transposase [Candidatus Obscuribacterales bacterium]|nr:transposase [Candidatus Obscuribacterales bacterium]